MEGFSDHEFERKENVFGLVGEEVKYHNFTYDEAKWYLDERPFDELDHQIANAVLALKGYIRDGKVKVTESTDSKEARVEFKKARDLLREDEPGVYFQGYDTPLYIRSSAYGRSLEAKSKDGESHMSELETKLYERFGLTQGNQEDDFISMFLIDIGQIDSECGFK